MQMQEKSELGIHGHRDPSHEAVGLTKVVSAARFMTARSRRNYPMIRFRNFLPFIGAGLVATAIIGASTPAHADFTVRVTDVNSSTGTTSTTQTQATANGAGVFNGTFLNVGNFSVTLVTDIATTGPGFAKASETLNISYNGPTPGGSTDKLIIEILDTNFTNPTVPNLAVVTSNASPSTTDLAATNVTMTSGVLANNATLGAAGTTLGGLLGGTTGTGTMGTASSVLSPNPVSGAQFAIFNPFAFYQSFTIAGITNTSAATGSISAGSIVSAVPEPGGVALALTGLSAMAGAGWVRRRKGSPSV